MGNVNINTNKGTKFNEVSDSTLENFKKIFDKLHELSLKSQIEVLKGLDLENLDKNLTLRFDREVLRNRYNWAQIYAKGGKEENVFGYVALAREDLQEQINRQGTLDEKSGERFIEVVHCIPKAYRSKIYGIQNDIKYLEQLTNEKRWDELNYYFLIINKIT